MSGRNAVNLGFWRVATGRKPGGTARSYWDHVVMSHSAASWILRLSAVTFFLAIAMSMVSLPVLILTTPISQDAIIFGPQLLLMASIGGFTLSARARRRLFLQTLKESTGATCLECGYCILGLDEGSACPECGTTVDWYAVISTWRLTFPGESFISASVSELSRLSQHRPTSHVEALSAPVVRGVVRHIRPWRVMVRRRPALAPRALWTRVVDMTTPSSALANLAAYVFGLGVVAFPAYVVVALVTGAGLSSVWLMITLGLVLVGYVFFYAAIGAIQSRLMADLRESKFRLCPFCGYSMKLAPSPSLCSECGEPYDVEAALAAWEAMIPELEV